MAEATFTFPADFRWGTATSSHQVEGNNTNNDWWAWEQEGARLGDNRIWDNQTSGLAANWWEDAEADIVRMADMGQNAHRMSVEWSRIEPEQGKWDEDAIARYREIIGAMRDAGIEPMVTLHHFTNPLWLAEQGGWTNEGVVAWFARYAGKVVDSLSDLVDLWCTINEPAILAGQGYQQGVWPPGEKSTGRYFEANFNMLRAHAAAYESIHGAQDSARVGLAKAMRAWNPLREGFFADRIAANLLEQVTDGIFVGALFDGEWRLPFRRSRPMPETKGTLDWWGVNYYHCYDTSFNPFKPGSFFLDVRIPTRIEVGPDEWGGIYPVGLYEKLRKMSRYGVPLYITENGRPDEHDQYRPRFIIEHLHQVWRAIQVGCPVMGYYFWSMVDNFEWAQGYNPAFRFGLWAVDVETQRRSLRTSGKLYAEVCQSGTVSSEMAREHAPDALKTVFQGEQPPVSV